MQGQALHGLQKLLGILAHGLCSGLQCIDQCLVNQRLGLGAGLRLRFKFCAYLVVELRTGLFHAVGESLGAGVIDSLLRVAWCLLRRSIFLSISAIMGLATLRIRRIGLRHGDTLKCCGRRAARSNQKKRIHILYSEVFDGNRRPGLRNKSARRRFVAE